MAAVHAARQVAESGAVDVDGAPALLEPCLEAIAAGKDVLVDKPCALDASEAAAMLAAAEAKGVRHFMDFELRCVPALVEAKRLIADGAIGDVRFVDFRCLGNFGFLEPTNPQFSHWNSKACGGGGFSAVGTHFTDLTRWLLDDEVAAASAVEAPLVEAIAGEKVTADGYCSAQLRLARRSDVGVHLTISARCPGRDFENRLTVVGTRGTFDFDFLESTLTVSSFGEGAPRVVSDEDAASKPRDDASLAFSFSFFSISLLDFEARDETRSNAARFAARSSSVARTPEARFSGNRYRTNAPYVSLSKCKSNGSTETSMASQTGASGGEAARLASMDTKGLSGFRRPSTDDG